MKNNKLLIFLFILLIFLMVCLVLLISYDKTRKKKNDSLVKEAVITYKNSIQGTQSETNKEKYINDYLILGIIEIDSLEISYPIIEYRDESSLNVSITKYYGDKINTNGVVALAGHTTRNGMFFGKLKNIEKGASVKITNEYGTIEYSVTKKYIATNENQEVFSQYVTDKKVVNLICCNENKKNWLVVEIVEKE